MERHGLINQLPEPRYILRTRIAKGTFGWTTYFPPALYCDGKCSTCRHRMYGLIEKCTCSTITLCGDAMPSEAMCIHLECEGWVQYQQGLITPNPGGATEGWKFYWSPEKKTWIRHYF